jgi:hypothetical protein
MNSGHLAITLQRRAVERGCISIGPADFKLRQISGMPVIMKRFAKAINPHNNGKAIGQKRDIRGQIGVVLLQAQHVPCFHQDSGWHIGYESVLIQAFISLEACAADKCGNNMHTERNQ